MSKYVKQLEMDFLATELEGVDDILVVDVIGLNSEQTAELRRDFRKKGLHLQMVRNNLARKVLEKKGVQGSEKVLSGSCALTWSEAGVVETAREVLVFVKKLEKLKVRGGCVSGSAIGPEDVTRLSKLPSKAELVGTVLGQLLGPIQKLIGQLNGPGAALASQIKQIAEPEGSEAAPANG